MSTAGATDLRFRAAVHADHIIANETWNRMFPDEAHGPEGMAHEWTVTESGWHIARFVIERDGTAVGMAFHHHAAWEKAPQAVRSDPGLATARGMARDLRACRSSS